MSQNIKELKLQLMQSKLSENFGKWRPYLELFFGGVGARGQKFYWGRGRSPLPGTAPGYIARLR